MSVTTVGRPAPIPARKYLNRVEVWRYQITTTGDGSGGTVDQALYLPETFAQGDLKDYPNGMGFRLEQVMIGHDYVAGSQGVILMNDASTLQDLLGSTTGIFAYFPTSYDTPGAGASASYTRPKLWLGLRAIWAITNPLMVFRQNNRNGSHFDLYVFLSTWNGIAEDLFENPP